MCTVAQANGNFSFIRGQKGSSRATFLSFYPHIVLNITIINSLIHFIYEPLCKLLREALHNQLQSQNYSFLGSTLDHLWPLTPLQYSRSQDKKQQKASFKVFTAIKLLSGLFGIKRQSIWEKRHQTRQQTKHDTHFGWLIHLQLHLRGSL